MNAEPTRVTFSDVPMRRGRRPAKMAEAMAEVEALAPGDQPLLFACTSLADAQRSQKELQRLARWRGLVIRTRTGKLGLYVWRPGTAVGRKRA